MTTPTSDREALLALADRCEKAACSDYALDLEIADYGYRNGALFGVNYDPQLWVDRNCWEPTVSLDHAMMLIPADLYPTIDFVTKRVWIRDANGFDVGFGPAHGFAATVPLSICAAALKARALAGDRP